MQGSITRMTGIICVLLLVSCGEGEVPEERAAGTVRMAQLLRRVEADSQRQLDPYFTSARLDSARALEPPSGFEDRLGFEASLAREALHVGRVEEAISEFADLLATVESASRRVSPSLRRAIMEHLAVAHIWRWKQTNCVEVSRSGLCRFPVETTGDVQAQGAARSAIEIYTSLLEADPDNLEYGWLLNLASMMAGRHPEGVPPSWLIPPEAFESEYDVKWFTDIAPELGLDVVGNAGGSVMDDFDGDGYLDIMASSWHLGDSLRFFRNNGDGTFSDRSVEAGLVGITGGLNMNQTDYNNDGHLDLLVLRGGWMPYGEPNSLLRNNGDGTFEDVTEQAGLLSAHPTQSGTWGDYDNDGWLDLYVGVESKGRRRHPSQLFHNNGDGTFTEVAREAGAAVYGYTKGVVWGDMDNDGRLDLYLSHLDRPNTLLRNEGPDASGVWRFSDVSASAGVGAPQRSFPTWFWDYDNDGWLDIFVSGYRGLPADVAAEYLGRRHQAGTGHLYRNLGDGRFRDVTRAARVDRIMISMGANYGDLDNDGYPDFYLGTADADFRSLIPNRMFRNAAGEYFQDVTTWGGFGLLHKGHGIAFGDFDEDGDQDIYAIMGGAHEGDLARNMFFRNPGHGNHWITLRLEGVRTNRAAIGARLKVTVETASGSRDIYSVVSSGGSFGASSLQQEIGLGDATAIRVIEINWPATGETDSYTDVDVDRIYRVREGDAALTPIP